MLRRRNAPSTDLAAGDTVPPEGGATVDWLEEEILSGRLAPGSRVNLDDLAAKRAAPWSEIRDSVSRLAGDGLASIEVSGHVLRVSPVSLADLRDLTDTRIAVETEAIRRSVLLGDAAWEERVRSAFARLSAVEPLMLDRPRDFLAEWEMGNEGFHEALDSACPLRRLMEFNRRLYKQHQRYRRLAVLGRRGRRDVHAEHLALFEAAMRRDAERAVAILAEHIANTVEQLADGIRDGSWFGVSIGG